MIDNLTEAIKKYKDFAECETETARVLRNVGNEKDAKYFEEAAENDKNIVSWLTELAERREADRWISVKEKLPEPHFSVVATDNNDVFVAWYDEGWNSSDSQFDKHTPIVAWRPIPQYTESEKGGAE